MSISAKYCNITVPTPPNCWFDYNNICRSYKLNLADPFDRVVAHAVLHLVAYHELYIIAKATYSPDLPKGFVSNFEVSNKGYLTGIKAAKTTNAASGVQLEFIQCLSNDKASYYDASQHQVLHKLRQTIIAATDLNAAVDLFNDTDVDGGGKVDSNELLSLLTSLGMVGVTMEQVNSIIESYDVDGSASLGLPEFQLFLKGQAGMLLSCDMICNDLIEFHCSSSKSSTR